MRVTHLGAHQAALTRLGTRLSEYSTTQERLSTGKQLTRSSDDPIGMNRALELRATLSARDQESRNATDGQMWLDLADTKLQDVVTQIQRARELAVRGATYTGPQEREAIALEIGHLRDDIVALANSQHQGRGLFSGFQAGDAVENVAGTWTYMAMPARSIAGSARTRSSPSTSPRRRFRILLGYRRIHRPGRPRGGTLRRRYGRRGNGDRRPRHELADCSRRTRHHRRQDEPARSGGSQDIKRHPDNHRAAFVPRGCRHRRGRDGARTPEDRLRSGAGCLRPVIANLARRLPPVGVCWTLPVPTRLPSYGVGIGGRDESARHFSNNLLGQVLSGGPAETHCCRRNQGCGVLRVNLSRVRQESRYGSGGARRSHRESTALP